LKKAINYGGSSIKNFQAVVEKLALFSNISVYMVKMVKIVLILIAIIKLKKLLYQIEPVSFAQVVKNNKVDPINIAIYTELKYAKYKISN